MRVDVFCLVCPLFFGVQFPGSLLKVVAVLCGIDFVEDSICRWSKPSVVMVCQLEEVIREVDANETSGEEGVALHGNLVGKSQLRIPKSALQTAFSRSLPLELLVLEYHDEFCALKSPSTRVSVVVIR